MPAIATGYVHKLRLEARDGAHIEIQPLPTPTFRRQDGWILAKFVGLALAMGSLLVVGVVHFVR